LKVNNVTISRISLEWNGEEEEGRIGLKDENWDIAGLKVWMEHQKAIKTNAPADEERAEKEEISFKDELKSLKLFNRLEFSI